MLLTEPILSLALDVVGDIQQGDELALGRLWSVLTKVSDVVIQGRRLENLTWRLWHRARMAHGTSVQCPLLNGLPPHPAIRPNPLSSPSLSFSSSSEGTGTTSSDWDRDTAVGEDDNVQVLRPGAQRNTAVSPHPEKARLDLVLGSSFQRLRATTQLPAPARKCHHLDSTQHTDCVFYRLLPSAVPLPPTPHHPVDTDAGHDPCRTHTQGVTLSDSLHHFANPALATAGLEVPSSSSPRDFSTSPHTFISPALAPSNTLPCRNLSDTDTSQFATETFTASSMPISLAAPHKDALTVGCLIAQLFSGNTTTQDTESQDRALTSGESKVSIRDNPPPLTPTIIEPESSTSPVLNTSSINPNSPSPTSNSTLTSATSTPRQMFPTVVVVNPTPHPTPPATPSPGLSDVPFGLNPIATHIARPHRSFENHRNNVGGVNEQLASPVSLNGDARSLDSPFVMAHSSSENVQLLKGLPLHPPRAADNASSSPFSNSSLLPAAAITLPEKPTDFESSSHLPTPASESSHTLQASEMANTSSKLASAPIPAPALSEDKKFFLAAPHSGSGGSGQDSSESPESLGCGSVSPDKGSRALGSDAIYVRSRDMAVQGQAVSRHGRLPREEDIASSFSASSPAGRAPSVTSSRGGSSKSSRMKGQLGFSVVSGSRRKPVAKKAVLQLGESAKEMGRSVKPMEGTQDNLREPGECTSRPKGKERQKGERGGDLAPGQALSGVKSTQHRPSHPSHPQPQTPSQLLRQLPTNPPRQQQSASRHPPTATASDVQSRPNPSAPPNTQQLPYHPQLGHLGLGHLPTVPPKQRRPIEITETSSEYETTDTEGDDSSWESESCSGNERGEGPSDAHEGPSKPSHEAEEHLSRNGKKSATTNSNRVRDPGEFARDAALEAQRQRGLFQKLPPRSYSHLGQLSRTKSGLSQLFHPDPALFPEGHPYRTTRSSQDILARNWSAPGPPLAMAALMKRGSVAVAGPMQGAVNTESVVSSANAKSAVPGASNGRQSNGRYRPRAKPEDEEEETESDEDDPRDAIQVSSSVAQRRLAALVGHRTVQPQQQQQQQRQHPSRTSSQPDATTQVAAAPQPVSRTTTAPVLMHPYLPDPAPLQTPHTVRRNIISQELDEELRRNLLWERSQNQIQGRPPRAPGSILPGPWRPLTALRQEENGEGQTNASDRAPGRRPFATQRTKSWAGDYHASGW